jgi:hypothetical protein
MYDIGIEISFQPYLIRENNECINLGKVIDNNKEKRFYLGRDTNDSFSDKE